MIDQVPRIWIVFPTVNFGELRAQLFVTLSRYMASVKTVE